MSSFVDSLALARELQRQRHPPVDQQLLACRGLVRTLPCPLPPGAAGQLVELGTAWLSAGACGNAAGQPARASAASAAAGSEEAAAAAAQLQAEAAHLFLRLLAGSPPAVKLQSGACRQLLQRLCCLARPGPALRPRQLPRGATAELACACMDLLALLPQWYPQPPKGEVAAAVAAVVAGLEQQAAWAGGAAESPGTTRLLCKTLKALQVLLTEAKKDHGANAASLALTLQRLFPYGLLQPGGSGTAGSSSGSPRRLSSQHAAAVPVAAPVASAAAVSAAGLSAGGSPSRPPSGLTSPAGKYRPPHARSSSSQQEGPEPTGGSPAAAGRQRFSSSSSGIEAGMGALFLGPLESSDSESSDVEGSVSGAGGERFRSSRVRSGALACLQLLAKADPKSLHGSWTALLPTSDAVSVRRGSWGAASSGTNSSSSNLASSSTSAAPSVAHLLLRDPQLRVRHAAAATVATLLEGPAQRAYLAVAEARDVERPPVRGFITLSASLGQMLVALHRALLHSIQREPDPAVLSSALRALGTLLLGAPYHRLPPQLLPLCVQGLAGCLARATPPGGPPALPVEQLPVVSACLACLAAAFSSKGSAAELAGQLHSPSASPPSPAALGSAGSQPNSGEDSPRGQQQEGQEQQLLELLFAYASCQQPALQLEAVMALRGVAQQHPTALKGCWDRLLQLGRGGAALPAPAAPQSPRQQQGAADGSVQEKVAQQSVRLPGDYLQHAGAAAEQLSAGQAGSRPATPDAASKAAAGSVAGQQQDAAGQEQLAQQWQQVADQVLAPAVQHSSALLRASAQAVVSALSPAAYCALPQGLQQRLLGWCCAAGAGDEASPVRAAGMRALGAVVASPAVCSLPQGVEQVLRALSSGCRDAVLAVRIPAVSSLAGFCHMLSQAAAASPAAGSSQQAGQPGQAEAAAIAAAATALPACLQLAASAAAADSDKLRPSALQALGSLFVLQAALPAPQQPAAQAEQQALLSAAADAVQQSLAAGSVRVQWAACEAARQLLAVPPPTGQPHWSSLLRQLLGLLQQSPNFRSRSLAAAALRGLGSRAALPAGDLAALLDSVAAVLFEGKASGFEVPAPDRPVPTTAPGQAAQQAQQQRPEPSELGSRSQLEAALVAAVLHLLALWKQAEGASDGVACSLSSQQRARLCQLVRQAQHELLDAQEVSPQPAGQPAGNGPTPGGFEGGAGLLDLSQVSAALAQAAGEALPLLQ